MSLAVMNSNQVKSRKLSEQQHPEDPSLGGNKRKLSAYHPTLGYAIPPPQPAKVARRNARERNRVKQVNCGFEVLRTHIPTAVKHKKMSKVDTLRHAVEYIQNLKRLLGEQEDISPPSPNKTPDIKRNISVPTPPTPPEQLSPPPPPASINGQTSLNTQLSNSEVISTQHHSSYYHSSGNSGHHASYSQYNNNNNIHPQHQPIHHANQHLQQHYDSGYETSSYYSLPSSGVSPTPPPPHPPVPHGSYPPPYPSLVRDGSASPSSPSVYSDYGPCNQLTNLNNNNNTSSNAGYMALDDFYNAEEDEILDAIVKWQED